MEPDLLAEMELVDLSLPIYDDAPIWSVEPRCIVHDWIVQGRTHGQLEKLNMKYFCMAGHQGTHSGSAVAGDCVLGYRVSRMKGILQP